MGNPFTTGGFNCCTCPEPPDYDPSVDPPLATYINRCGCPSVAVVCTSENKTATLCGYNEFNTASVPPKKYRKKVDITHYSSANYSCCSGGVIKVNDQAVEVTARNYTYEYNANDCSFTTIGENGQLDYTTFIVCTNTVSSTSTGPISTIGASEYTVNSTTNKTADSSTRTFQTTGPCPTLPYLRSEVNHTGEINLSIEDTEADALARETATTGTSCSSIYQLRTTLFNFTKRTATYSATVTNLVVGVEYEGCVRIRKRESYSGTPPAGADTEWEDVEPDTISSFTATDTEEEVATDVDVPNAQGYEYEVVSAHVWASSAGCDCPTSYTP